MEDLQVSRPPTAELLGEWRARLRLSKQRLAELADVSATYVRNIESGFDESGRPVVPSANVIQKLARGLARAEPDDAVRAETERRAYATLMLAAGYLPGEPADAERLLHQPPEDYGAKALRAGPDSRAPAVGRRLPGPLDAEAPVAPAEAASVVIALRDRRLGRHLRGLLDNWEALASDDQALLLGIAEFVAERRRRREGGG